MAVYGPEVFLKCSNKPQKQENQVEIADQEAIWRERGLHSVLKSGEDYGG